VFAYNLEGPKAKGGVGGPFKSRATYPQVIHRLSTPTSRAAAYCRTTTCSADLSTGYPQHNASIYINGHRSMILI